MDLSAALEWKDGLILHLHERLRTEPRGDGVAADRNSVSRPNNLLETVPESAILLVSSRLDVVWLIETLREIVPKAERSRFDAALSALGGMCYGKDVVREIAPSLGPQAMAFLIPSTTPEHLFDVVASIQMKPEANLEEALRNGVKTLFSLAVLDSSAKEGRSQIVHDPSTSMITLEQKPRSWAVVVRPDLFAVGSSPLALSGWLKDTPRASNSRLLVDRRTYASEASTFGILDCQALANLAESRREFLVKRWVRDQGRSEAEVANDVDKAIQLVSLFRVGFASASVDAEGASAHQKLGLIFATDSTP